MQFSKQRQEKSHKTQKIKQKIGENVFKDKIGYNTKREFVQKKTHLYSSLKIMHELC